MSSSQTKAIWPTLLWIFIILAALGGITYAAIRFSPNGKSWTGGGEREGRFCRSSCPECPTDVLLPASSPLPIPKLTQDTPPWFISKDIADTPRISIEDDALRVDYVPFKFSTDSGAEFKANPLRILPSDSAVLRYSVYFPPDFPWTKGGKLPGFCISDYPDGCATGSRWSDASGSVRVMFRQEGRAIGYVYIPLQVADAKPGPAGIAQVNAVQSPEFQDVSNLPSVTTSGIDLWCKASGGLQFQAGVWNNVTLVLKMNDIGQKNGRLSLTVNQDTRQIEGMLWRVARDVEINQVLFATFFGGGDSSWMIQEPTFSLFRDFGVAAPLPNSTAEISPSFSSAADGFSS